LCFAFSFFASAKVLKPRVQCPPSGISGRMGLPPGQDQNVVRKMSRLQINFLPGDTDTASISRIKSILFLQNSVKKKSFSLIFPEMKYGRTVGEYGNVNRPMNDLDSIFHSQCLCGIHSAGGPHDDVLLGS
jgi:hypothetical protein